MNVYRFESFEPTRQYWCYWEMTAPTMADAAFIVALHLDKHSPKPHIHSCYCLQEGVTGRGLTTPSLISDYEYRNHTVGVVG